MNSKYYQLADLSLEGEILQEQLAYWKQQLREPLPVLELPTDRPRPAIPSRRRAKQSLVLSQDLTASLKELSQREGVTLYMTLLAAFKILLHRYTGQQDIVVGSPLAQRMRTEDEELRGGVAHTLVLRTDLSGNPNFREFMGRIREVVSDAYTYQNVPLEKVIEKLELSRDWSHSSLFQVMFALESASLPSLELSGLTLSLIKGEQRAVQVDLSLLLQETAGGLSGVVEYNPDLFDSSTIVRLAGHFKTVLEGAVVNPDDRIAILPLLTAVERQQLLVEWNATHQAYPSDQCLHHLIEAQVERTPEAVAVMWEDQRLTYKELNVRANQLAHYLRKQGVGPEVLVGICAERSLEMVVGMLGILKAGGAYVPLDPTYPRERLIFMLEDAQIGTLLTQQRLVKTLPGHDAKVVCLDRDWEVIARESDENPQSAVTPDDLAYVIYTSGSTGKPKGVQVLQRGVVNFLSSLRHRPGLTAQDTLLAVTTISFDIAALELFLPLIVGARVILIGREVAKDGQLLNKALVSSGATVMQATPATWRLLLEAGWPGSQQLTILCGGEALSWELAERLLPKAQALWNLYGPTETTIWSTLHPVTGEKGPIPIGRPIANTEIYILDASLLPAPVGVPGELYIGGAGVAKGYLNRPELTTERFIPHPFQGERGARLYKTGDLARYRPDGNIEFLGRLDTQVKLRGFRIELGEIEAMLARHPAVQQVVVVAREDRPGDQRLVAYSVPAQRPVPNSQELRHFLHERVPDYMVPSAFVWLDALPLTPNGKVDRRALPAPDQTKPELARAFVAPRDALERLLTKMWEAALNVKPIGVQDNFFELGGHSLLAVRLCEQMEQKFGKNLSPATLFQAPTIEQLSYLLRQENYVAHSWSLMVPFQAGGSKPPFFCLFCSAELALLLGPDQPFYALQPHGLAGRRAPATIEAAAADYLQEIQAVQPEGPYFLGGFSFGGPVVFEMAQQLTKQGQQVAFLALLDPPVLPHSQCSPPVSPTSLQSLTANRSVREQIARHTHALSLLGSQKQLVYVLERVTGHLTATNKRIKRMICHLYLGLGRRLPFSLRAFYFLETGGQAIRKYVPFVYSGCAVLFRAQGSAPHLPAEWSSLVAGGLEVHEVPGNHFDIIREPYVRTLAAKLGACLSQAQAVKAGKGNMNKVHSTNSRIADYRVQVN